MNRLQWCCGNILAYPQHSVLLCYDANMDSMQSSTTLLEEPGKIAVVLNVTLPLQIIAYIVAAALLYVWRNLDELVYTQHVGVLQIVSASFYGLGLFNLVLLTYGTLEAPNKKHFLNLYRMLLVCFIILLILLAHVVRHWIAQHAGAGMNLPFIG